MKIICFLSRRPCIDFYNLCKELINDNTLVFICVDDNDYNIPGIDDSIKIIKINQKECSNAGYNYMYGHSKIPTARDKALYYFNLIYKNDYKDIWFIEDDVLIPSKNTISNIDKKYIDNDYLVKDNVIKENPTKNDGWAFPYILDTTEYRGVFSISGIMAIRLSKKMMNAIDMFVKKYEHAFFCEAFFGTVALNYNISITVIPELFYMWPMEQSLRKRVNGCYKENNLYHPLKSIARQRQIRDSHNKNIIDK
tara:strand:- start:1034 stop:1789 length:756 start_codon:yes stop_codon:yes gene_type:complete